MAFRDTNGVVGLIAANCPHRGASLFFGRNEEAGSAASTTAGSSTSPARASICRSEPAESNFKSKMRATAYPARDRGGLIWTYMGPPEKMPGPPEVRVGDCAAEHRRPQTKGCRIAAGLPDGRGRHRLRHSPSFKRAAPDAKAVELGPGFVYKRDTSPRFEVLETEYGFLFGARRDAEDDNYYWRITAAFVLPWYTTTPGPFLGRQRHLRCRGTTSTRGGSRPHHGRAPAAPAPSASTMC